MTAEVFKLSNCKNISTVAYLMKSVEYNVQCMEKNTKTFFFFKSSFVLHKRKSVIQILNDTQASKWWHNINFCMARYLFTDQIKRTAICNYLHLFCQQKYNLVPHSLDCLYDSLSSPPVAGVWWAHTLDCLYDSLSSPPVAGVWWAHTLDCLYDSLSLSTCSWCVVSAYTWLSLWLSLLSTCSWCVVSAYTWLSLWLSLLSTCSWCVVSAYTWLSLWLSLLSTCSWCVVRSYTWLALSLSPLHL